MFYSHQLLARKAPLGQIWMVATMHAKIKRKKLHKLNIIKICEEILNPPVPMALRLSGILMGGVVIVYESKVKLLYDDVTRLLVEINEAWKLKTETSDPTRLPKGKSQAKYESVTLPPNRNEDLEDTEEPLPYSKGTVMMDFQQTSYIAMRLCECETMNCSKCKGDYLLPVRLDSVDDTYLNLNLEGDLNHDHHQADADNITLVDNYDSYKADATTFNRFQRFDTEGDDGTQMNYTPPEQFEIPSPIPSPPRQEEHQKADEIKEQHAEEQVNQQANEAEEVIQDQVRRKLARRRGRKPAASVTDFDEQTVIPNCIYGSWLQDPSDIVSKRRGKRKPKDAFSMMKMATKMELPSIVLIEKLASGNGQIQYPAPLLELWKERTQLPHDLPSVKTSQPQPHEPSPSSPPEGMDFMEPMGDPFEEFQSRVDSLSKGIPIEKQRTNTHNKGMPPKMFMKELRNNLRNNGLGSKEANGMSDCKANLMATPGNNGLGSKEANGMSDSKANLMANPDDDIRSIPSSGSGHGFFSHNAEVNTGLSGKKRPFSASKNSGNGLEPVAKELPLQHPDPSFKLAKLSEKGFTPDHDFMVETGPTNQNEQKQNSPVTNQPLDPITDSIRTQLKTHFDTPGSAKEVSLDQLAFGMDKKGAASLFYQICVLATRDCIKVEQKEPYGDILISRGAKM